MRKIVAVVGAVVLVASLFGWWLFAESFRKMDGTELVPPGKTSVTLEAGTYRIFVDGQLGNSDQCSTDDHFSDVQGMGLELAPRGGGRTIEPKETTICDGGNDQGELKPLSVSEFRVEDPGDYVLRGAAGLPGITAYNRPVTVFLKDTTDRQLGFTAGLGGNLAGVFLLAFGLKRRRS